MSTSRVNRWMDFAIGVALGVILGALAMVAMRGCNPGESAATPSPAQSPAGIDIGDEGGCSAGNAHAMADARYSPAGENPASRPSIPSDSAQDRLARFFDAIFAHESVGGTVLVGDKGKSRGPFHIQRGYWQDGGGDPKTYDRLVDNRAECERVMLAYFRRYEPEALARENFEALARLHNGGPNWREKPVTVEYWAAAKEKMP